MDADVKLVVGVGGTTRPGSSSEAALRLALALARGGGATTEIFDGAVLAGLPMYDPAASARTDEALRLVDAVRRADAVVISSAGYHGSIAGVVKNAVDYIEDLREDDRPYLDGRAVGCMATGAGWQAVVNTLHALRSVTHALRGWPTPIGVAIKTVPPVFAADGTCTDEHVRVQVGLMVAQILSFGGATERERVPALGAGGGETVDS